MVVLRDPACGVWNHFQPPCLVSLYPVEPTVTLDVSAHDLLNCRAGTTVRIPATITGRPIPKVTWTFDGTAETEKKNELHTLPVDSEVSPTFHQVLTQRRGRSGG